MSIGFLSTILGKGFFFVTLPLLLRWEERASRESAELLGWSSVRLEGCIIQGPVRLGRQTSKEKVGGYFPPSNDMEGT